jgi:hypothetical protein
VGLVGEGVWCLEIESIGERGADIALEDKVPAESLWFVIIHSSPPEYKYSALHSIEIYRAVATLLLSYPCTPPPPDSSNPANLSTKAS